MKFWAVGLLVCVVLAAAVDSKPPRCLLPHSQDGDGLKHCLADIPKYSYDAQANACVKFFYGGCGGNQNRFRSKKNCEKTCKS